MAKSAVVQAKTAAEIKALVGVSLNDAVVLMLAAIESGNATTKDLDELNESRTFGIAKE